MSYKVVEIERHHVKKWVVENSKVTNPYKKKWWYASVTIGYDYNEKGESIEKAYINLVELIFSTPFIMNQLKNYNSFRIILGLDPK